MRKRGIVVVSGASAGIEGALEAAGLPLRRRLR
jgi:hypothetical protein